jgi:hypothetical protein
VSDDTFPWTTASQLERIIEHNRRGESWLYSTRQWLIQQAQDAERLRVAALAVVSDTSVHATTQDGCAKLVALCDALGANVVEARIPSWFEDQGGKR